MSDDDGKVLPYRKKLELASDNAPAPGLGADGGGGASGGTTGWQRDVERRLGQIEDRIMVLPTRNDLLAYLALGLAAMGIVAGGLVSGLGWLETRVARVQPASATAAPVQPIVIQIPTIPEPRSHRR